MRNYTLLRFVRLNLYFFVMYCILTAVWYGLNGRFAENGTVDMLKEIALNAAIFSLLFSLAMLLLYRRTELRIPVQKYTAQQLQQRLEEIGFVLTTQQQSALQVYKPSPPKAPALAGSVFVQQTANFWLMEGPQKYVMKLKG
ncbi:hypothetical protein POKO110462_15385 [Pontibacter korlensis]|uniref:Uncharacterized protein n=1 Tax=Pontibacter korlensis TaxID=400092 RepID=A0A0E3UXC0_9BACT|nr:hypothetical protein [Pontibacter korlensis]AKD04107.1 hypothetical protein PKOR_14670 [Pontibacter korlensis]